MNPISLGYIFEKWFENNYTVAAYDFIFILFGVRIFIISMTEIIKYHIVLWFSA